MRTEEKCIYCDRTATKLCDYILGFSGKEIGKVPGPVLPGEKCRVSHQMVFDNPFDHDAETYTCDAPLCDIHAVKGEVTFYCGGGDSYNICGAGGCSGDSEAGVQVDDYCPVHPHQNYDFRPMRAWEANRARMAERLKAACQVQRRQEERWLD